jgi:hypothetical protein
MDKLRLLLRSVYLKGHQDGNIKTSDMSWEDKIVESLKQVFLGMLPEEKYLIDNLVDDLNEMVRIKDRIDGFNSAIQEMKRRMNEDN